ncbi:hypothetical protein [Arthrobacter sp. 35W]|uniref:hypothetical protein n=1 Tax=Arthrobacter sp. 35W TaxID=1132441 RepID=UPI0004024298|nr:hypothetical protein [Arthrobacter sp. 35W]
MDSAPSSPAAVAAFESVAADLASTGVVAGKMFGARALLLDKKALACLNGEHMAFKLGRDSPRHAAALAVPGAELFDPSGMGRPFKDWVDVPLSETAAAGSSWEDFGHDAVAAAAA